MTFPGIFPITFFAAASVAAPAGGIVVSIQPFEIAIASGAASNTATISDVDATRTVIFPANLTQTNSTSLMQHSRARVTLANSSAITATRGNGVLGDLVVRGVAVEFNSTGVESVQYGTTTFVSALQTATTTIASANLSRTAIILLGCQASGSTSGVGTFTPTVRLTDPTTVTINRDESLTSTPADVNWVAVRFNPGVADVQHHLFTSVSAGLSEQHAFGTPVNPARTFVGWGGFRGSASTEQEVYHTVNISSSAAATIQRDDGSATRRTVAFNTIEVAAAHISSIQRGSITIISSALSGTATITSADTSKTAVIWNGFRSNGDQPNEQESTAKLSDATTITAEKGAISQTGTDTATVGYEAVTFV